MNFDHVIVSKIGLKRKNNEDAAGVFDVNKGLLVIVCDGLGGNKGGEVASSLSVETIYKSFRDSDEPDYLLRIKVSIEEANELLLDQSDKNSAVSGMATTAEVLFIEDDILYFGHVGDSRIYEMKNDKIKQLTKDHSLVQQLVDNGILTSVEAESHPNRNVIVRAIGDSEEIEVDLFKMKLNNEDDLKFFVCTDGVSCVVFKNELEEILRDKNINQISNNIISAVELNGAPDNFTFVILSKK